MSDIKGSSALPIAIPMDPTTPVTPHHQSRSASTGLSVISMSDRSASDVKRKLELRLADTRTKKYNIGRLGESLVKQEQELVDRIKEMDSQSQEEEIKPELRSKLADLENGFKEIERESAKAFSKTTLFLGKENMGHPRTPGDSPTKSEFVGHGTVSPSKSQHSPRKARNATPRQHDIEFAADIGQGLLDEVRKSQALLAQREQKLSEATASIARSERQLELYERKVKQMHEEQESLKEENWNMHLRGQQIQMEVNTAVSDLSKFTTENARLVAQTASLTTAVESLKLKNAELSTSLEDTKSKHEGEMSSLRRAQAGLQRDRSDLQRHIDDLKLELSKRPEPKPDNPDDGLDANYNPEKEKSITPVTQSPTASPQLSPIKNTPSRNAPLELETTKSSLHHAHRMVTNLRNNLHREKTEKLELKRLLAAAQDEVEQLRSKASGSKRAGKRPQLKRPTVDMLGNNRKTKHEISLEINLQDKPQLLDAAWNDDEGSASAAYVTANEESDAAFVTAAENEPDETDTEAYRTGVESQPDSDDGELTETESTSSHHMPNLGFIRELSPAVAFTSDEDDSPIRLVGLKHRRSTSRTEIGRRMASSAFDPPPQPLFQELMEGAGSSVVNSPLSVMDSPTSVGTAVPLSPILALREAETEDAACQCDPVPEPDQIIIEAPPVVVYRERERPPYTETGTQSDPTPDPEPFVLLSSPITIYREREMPIGNDIATQSDPVPDPDPVIVELPPVIIYKEPERPTCSEIGTQSDPVPDPEPVIVELPPVIIYKDPERPTCSEIGTQSDPIPPPEPIIVKSDPIIIPAEPVIITKYIEREKPISDEVAMQTDPIPPPEPVIIKSDPIIIPAEPVIVTKYIEREKPLSADATVQSDPVPPPEPIILKSDPIIIPAEPVIVTKYVEREKPPSADATIQSDPIPPPKQVIIRPDPIVITAEPVIVTKYVEKEKPLCAEVATQSDPSPPPAQIIVYKEPERPAVVGVAVQSDPIPEPQPILIPTEPVIIYRDREVPPTTEIGVQSEEITQEPVEPTITYIERERPLTNDIGIQPETLTPDTKEVGRQSEIPVPVGGLDKGIQTPISIPFLESYQFHGQGLPPTTLRPKTPISTPPPSITPLHISPKPVEAVSDGTPRTIKSVSSVTDWELRPKSPLREITNSRQSEPGSPSRSSMRFTDSPSTFSSRVGSSRRYGSILEHPTLRPSPRSTVKSRMSHPNSPSKIGQKRPQTISPAHSRMNMSVASRPTTAMSGRTSISSFESEVDDRFGLNREEGDGLEDRQYATATDPRIIQSITQTMIGEFLYKYTRNQMQRSKISEKRHKRFFWIHPYTKTLYWSTDNPATSKDSNPPIKKVAVVTDENPFPPGLFQKSILCFAQSRALSHLLDRGPMLAQPNEGDVLSAPSMAGTTGYSMDMREFGAIGTRSGTVRMASLSTIAAGSDADVKHHGSFSRLSSMFRGDRGTMSTVKGKDPARSVYEEASMITDFSRHSEEHIHDIDEEGLENVRACCGGKHDVGTLTRKGKHVHK